MIHLIFDLDGTLVDHRGRTYGLHVAYCQEHGYAPVPTAAYRARKAEGESERQTVRDSIPAGELDGYMEWKRAHIESDEALALDTARPEMLALLGRLSRRAKLVLLTSRQSEPQARKELLRLGIAERFGAVLAAPSDGSTTSKLAALREYLDRAAAAPSSVILIGDTECEIEVARAVGAACLSVTWGIRGEAFLAARRPDGIARSVAELERLIEARLRPAVLRQAPSTSRPRTRR
jgi:phosphoglycolate phosphatase